MSPLGQKRTSERLYTMSALPPKAGIGTQPLNVRFVPKADSCTAANSALFNHLIGGHLHDQRHGKTKPLGGLEIDHELEFGGLYDRQIARLLALEDPTRVHTNLAISICNAGCVAYQTPCRGILAQSIARRQSIPCRQRDDLIPIGERERVARDNQRTKLLAAQRLQTPLGFRWRSWH